MTENKSNIALLLGDPAGIGPELISKLLNDEMTKKANIVIIGEKQVFESGNSITGISHNIDVVENFDEINFDKSKTKDMFPLLRQEKLKRSFIFHDAQTDDAKLVVTLLRNAVEINNAFAINYMEITDIKKQSSKYQITAINKLNGNKFLFFANNIISSYSG